MQQSRTMKAKILFAALTALMLTSEHLAGQALSQFSSAEGQFSILVPGKPKAGTYVLRTRDASVTAHAFSASSSSMGLMCGYYDFPSPQADVERIFDNTRDGSLKYINGKLLHEEKVTLDGYAGRRFRSTGIRNVFLDEEMFLVGQRMYLITITTATRTPNSDIGRIFASFRLGPKGQ